MAETQSSLPMLCRVPSLVLRASSAVEPVISSSFHQENGSLPAEVMVKLALETSLMSLSSTKLTRTVTLEEGSLATVHRWEPSLGVEATMVLASLTKPSVEYSSLTFPILPTLVQLMYWSLRAVHSSPPLGEVMSRVGSTMEVS